MALLLSTGLGAVLSAFLPVGAFLFVVPIAALVNIGLALTRGDALGLVLLDVSLDAACAQAGYVAGVVASALVSQALRRPQLPQRKTPISDTEDEGG